MSLRVRLLFNFPYFKVLALSIIIALLGLASIVLSAIGFVREIWGHYVGSGIWCGTFVFVTGICGIAAAHWKGIYSVRLFLATSIVSCFLSVAELGLSAGGLDYNSDFYIKVAKYANADHGPTKLIHGLLLMISVLQFVLSFITAYICAYHACFKKYTKTPTPAATGQSRKRFLRGSSRESNASTSSRAPLHIINDENKRNSKRRKRSTRHEQSNGDNNHPDSRPLLRESQHEQPEHSRKRNNENDQRRQRTRPRSSHRPRRDQHEEEPIQRLPDEDLVIENTIPHEPLTQYVALQPAGLVCSYYHDDEPPIPIDEDDELPPYEEVVRDTECEDDSTINESQTDTYNSRNRGGSSCSSYEHISSSNGSGSTSYSGRSQGNRNFPRQQNFMNIPENNVGRTLTDRVIPNNHIVQGNVTAPSCPPVPPKLPTSEREAFLKDYWLSDHPQGISYCGFSRNDCPVKENIPRSERARSFHRQVSREREFAKQNVLVSRRLSDMENGEVVNPFSNKHQFFKDYVKSQPNIRGKLHDSQRTSTSSICSLPSDNPPPKPPRLFSLDSPIKLEINTAQISAKSAITNAGEVKNTTVDARDFDNTYKTKEETQNMYMNLGGFGKSQNMSQENNFMVKNLENTTGYQKPDEENDSRKVVNLEQAPNPKIYYDFSQPIGYSTPKSSLMMPTSPGLSPIETSKPIVQLQQNIVSDGNGTLSNKPVKEEFAKLEDSPKIFKFKSSESKTDSDISKNLSGNKSDQKYVMNNEQPEPQKLYHAKSTSPNFDDKFSLRPYLIRDNENKSCEKVPRTFRDTTANDQNGKYFTCLPSPEIKYVTKNPKDVNQNTDGKFKEIQTSRTEDKTLSIRDRNTIPDTRCASFNRKKERETDTKEPSHKNKDAIDESNWSKILGKTNDPVKESTLTSQTARRQLFSPESNQLETETKLSKIPVLTLRPVQFDFNKDIGNRDGDVNKKGENSLKEGDIKDQAGNTSTDVLHHNERRRPETLQAEALEEEQSSHHREESSAQRLQDSSNTSDGQRRKPIYSILL